MQINKSVTKTVKDAQGKDFKRKANIKFDFPGADLGEMVAAFGSVENLHAAALFGVYQNAYRNASAELLKGDTISKALKKMVAGLKAALPTLTDEAATAMLLNSNPEIAKAFSAGPVSAEIDFPVSLVSTSKDKEGKEVPPINIESIVTVAENEEDEEETEAAA